jgi:hypothetical protein
VIGSETGKRKLSIRIRVEKMVIVFTTQDKLGPRRLIRGGAWYSGYDAADAQATLANQTKVYIRCLLSANGFDRGRLALLSEDGYQVSP